MSFLGVPEKINFPETEKKVLEYWAKIDAFKTSLERSKGKPEYSFYDGPPFATGLPHYGHLLAGTVKDTVTRFQTMTGHFVPRRFGWDTHGLPVEFEIDKKFGLNGADDVIKFGIPNYNAECRKIVMKYSTEWRNVVNRIGRWIDMDDDYKTMDIEFMESVWWVFKQLFSKGLVYRGFKVMPFSTGCSTPLSNFEAGLDYRDVTDPAVHVLFETLDDSNKFLIAWTTTPWTLPSNLALCVNPELTYVTFEDTTTKKQYIMCENLLKSLPALKARKVLSKCKGKELEGLKYKPLFDFFKDVSTAFRVICDPYVTSDGGTGVVHCAPAFGEDDYRVSIANGIINKNDKLVCAVDNNGRLQDPVTTYKGLYVKEADAKIMDDLKAKGLLLAKGTIVHSYPYCWRSGTPLIYRAIDSWFVEVEKIKDKLLVNNLKSSWVPQFVQEKRFHNWLANAHDWAISRNRFWGTPLPIWTDENYTEFVAIGSVAELEERTGTKVTDLHRESIDNLEIKGKDGKILRRVPEVFDCWFESGSMPYAQLHYPFENKERFDRTFPADFVAEGIDQTRGWFYTLLVLGTALFDTCPFKNLIVHGLVLAADGKKMSKSLRNYPDPLLIADAYGADALRLYLINSPVVRGENLRFQEKGVKELLGQVFLPWFNTFRFFVLHAEQFKRVAGKPFVADISKFYPSKTTTTSTKHNIMDVWMLSLTQSLAQFVGAEMEAYRLFTVVPQLVNFIGTITNWYLRFNRNRMKTKAGDEQEDAFTALSVLAYVLSSLCKIMAPFTPFFVEYVYQELRPFLAGGGEESVHYLDFPVADKELTNTAVEQQVDRFRRLVELGRTARERRHLPLKYPLKTITTIIGSDADKLGDDLVAYLAAELNVAELVQEVDDESDKSSSKGVMTAMIKVSVEADRAKLGRRLRDRASAVYTALSAMTASDIKSLLANGNITVCGDVVVNADEVKVRREFVGDVSIYEAAWEGGDVVVLDTRQDAELRQRGVAREVVNRVQKARKKCGLLAKDEVSVFYSCEPENGELAAAVAGQADGLTSLLGTMPLPMQLLLETTPAIITDVSVVKGTENNETLTVVLADVKPVINFAAVAKAHDEATAKNVATVVASWSKKFVLETAKANENRLVINFEGKEVVLVLGETLFASPADLARAK